MIFRLLLLLSVLACVAFSQSIVGGRTTCLCQSTRDRLGVSPQNIVNLDIFPPSNFCEKLEIIINLKNGNQFCLNPEAQKIRQMIQKLKSQHRKKMP